GVRAVFAGCLDAGAVRAGVAPAPAAEPDRAEVQVQRQRGRGGVVGAGERAQCCRAARGEVAEQAPGGLRAERGGVPAQQQTAYEQRRLGGAQRDEGFGGGRHHGELLVAQPPGQRGGQLNGAASVVGVDPLVGTLGGQVVHRGDALELRAGQAAAAGGQEGG